jgi:hypothetical protein
MPVPRTGSPGHRPSRYFREMTSRPACQVRVRSQRGPRHRRGARDVPSPRHHPRSNHRGSSGPTVRPPHKPHQSRGPHARTRHRHRGHLPHGKWVVTVHDPADRPVATPTSPTGPRRRRHWTTWILTPRIVVGKYPRSRGPPASRSHGSPRSRTSRSWRRSGPLRRRPRRRHAADGGVEDLGGVRDRDVLAAVAERGSDLQRTARVGRDEQRRARR